MLRRNFFIKSSLFALSANLLASKAILAQTQCPSPTSVSTSGINCVEEIKSLRIPTGPYAGAYEIAPNGLSNWYFTNLGLISIIQYLSGPDLDKYIRTYLDLYLSKLEPDLSIKDIQFPFGRVDTSNFKLVLSDSDDSYAATTLTLATRYLRASQNWVWWDQNKQKLKDIAYRNLAVSTKSNGLTSVFQSPRNQTNNTGYLMDNCEAYRGLRDFSAMLNERGDAQSATYFGSFANGIASSLAGLFVQLNGAFRVSDASPLVETSFYPGTTCQIFPQVFGVNELAPYFDKAWNFLSVNSVGWEKGSLDPFPFAVVGFAAAKRGQIALAQNQISYMDKLFVSNRALMTINELGFYQRTKSVLLGRTDV